MFNDLRSSSIQSTIKQPNYVVNMKKVTSNIKKNNYKLNIDDKINCSSSKNKIYEIDDIAIEESYLTTFSKYLVYLIYCGKNNSTFSYYEEFRIKLISEKNLIQSYFDLFQLFKIHNLQKKISSIILINMVDFIDIRHIL